LPEQIAQCACTALCKSIPELRDLFPETPDLGSIHLG
jgi:hypothetical protein